MHPNIRIAARDLCLPHVAAGSMGKYDVGVKIREKGMQIQESDTDTEPRALDMHDECACSKWESLRNSLRFLSITWEIWQDQFGPLPLRTDMPPRSDKCHS